MNPIHSIAPPSMRLEFLPANAPGFAAGMPPARGIGGDEARRLALAGRPRPTGLGVFVPRDVADVPRPPSMDPTLLERAELIASLRHTALSRCGASHGSAGHIPEAVASSLGRLARDDAAVVVCGQQPGFLGGPLLDAVKTLHAMRLARELEDHFGTPVLPLYWNHGDDHDADEVRSVHLVNPNLDVVRVGLASFGAARRPLSHRPVDRVEQRLEDVRGALAALLPGPSSRVADVLDLLMPRDGETLVAARTRAWYELFGHHGLLVLEPEGQREAHGRALARIVLAHPADALARARARLGALVADDEDRAPALVYELTEGGESNAPTESAKSTSTSATGVDVIRRAARPLPGGGWRFDGEPESAERTDEELAAAIRAAPKRWSAGALLRPLVQDALLPVAAYVGGPGELAYHTWLAELRESARLPDTPFVPRVSVCISTPLTRAAAAKLGTSVGEYLRSDSPRQIVQERVEPSSDPLGAAPAAAPTPPKLVSPSRRRSAVAAADPAEIPRDATTVSRPGSTLSPAATGSEQDAAEVAGALEAMLERHAAELASLRARVAPLDRGLAQQLRRASAQGHDLVLKVVRKLRRLGDNRRGKLHRHRRRLAAFLRPRGRSQERALGIAPLLTAAGTAWLDRLLEEIDPFPTECVVVHLGEEVAADGADPRTTHRASELASGVDGWL